MDRFLKQLPSGWVKSEKGYVYQNEHGKCELIRNGKFWVVVNEAKGGKWAQCYTSFKQVLAALAGN